MEPLKLALASACVCALLGVGSRAEANKGDYRGNSREQLVRSYRSGPSSRLGALGNIVRVAKSTVKSPVRGVQGRLSLQSAKARVNNLSKGDKLAVALGLGLGGAAAITGILTPVSPAVTLWGTAMVAGSPLFLKAMLNDIRSH